MCSSPDDHVISLVPPAPWIHPWSRPSLVFNVARVCWLSPSPAFFMHLSCISIGLSWVWKPNLFLKSHLKAEPIIQTAPEASKKAMLDLIFNSYTHHTHETLGYGRVNLLIFKKGATFSHKNLFIIHASTTDHNRLVTSKVHLLL